MTDDAAVLAGLDFESVVCNGIPPCGRDATHVVEMHAVDRCATTGHPDGNLVLLLCAQHVWALGAESERYAAIRSRFGVAQCTTCGAPIACGDDLIRSVKGL